MKLFIYLFILIFAVSCAPEDFTVLQDDINAVASASIPIIEFSASNPDGYFNNNLTFSFSLPQSLNGTAGCTVKYAFIKLKKGYNEVVWENALLSGIDSCDSSHYSWSYGYSPDDNVNFSLNYEANPGSDKTLAVSELNKNHSGKVAIVAAVYKNGEQYSDLTYKICYNTNSSYLDPVIFVDGVIPVDDTTTYLKIRYYGKLLSLEYPQMLEYNLSWVREHLGFNNWSIGGFYYKNGTRIYGTDSYGYYYETEIKPRYNETTYDWSNITNFSICFRGIDVNIWDSNGGDNWNLSR